MWFATMPAVAYVDKLGRKPILIVGAIGMATCHIIIAVIFAKNENQWETHKGAGWAAVVMVWLFVVHFGYSWGPCAWIIIAEIWPLSQRPYGIALGGKCLEPFTYHDESVVSLQVTASSNWMNNFIIGQVTPDMLEHLRYGTVSVIQKRAQVTRTTLTRSTVHLLRTPDFRWRCLHLLLLPGDQGPVSGGDGYPLWLRRRCCC